MYTAVFEVGWDSDELMRQQRAAVEARQRRRRQDASGLDGTYGHPERGPDIYGVNRAYAPGKGWLSRDQSVVTAVAAKADSSAMVEQREAKGQLPYAHCAFANGVLSLTLTRLLESHGKQVLGLEAAKYRNEEAVKRHFRLSCVAQSLLQQTVGSGRKSERFAFADQHQQAVGQRLYNP